MKLDAIKFGITCGIVWAGGVLCLGLMGEFLHIGIGLLKGIGSIYLGYKATPLGVLIGTVWAFFDAGIGGWLVATIYNWMVGRKK